MQTPAALENEWNEGFDQIRCAHDHEVPDLINALANMPGTESLFAKLSQVQHAGNPSFDTLTSGVQTTTQVLSRIKDWIAPGMASGDNQVSFTGFEQLNSSESYIFVSNHRDIILDPLLVNLGLMNHGFSPAHCAIGDNLLQSDVATALAKLTHCFKVVRSLSSPKALLKAMKLQSEYVRHLHFSRGEHIWIAQKEGRSKDNLDLTNPALVKMLALAKPKTVELDDYLNALNIVPVSISYEWDPCDIDKAQQLTSERNGSAATKEGNEDIHAMGKSLMQSKGKMSVAVGAPIRRRDQHVLNQYEVANRIDHFIHTHYTLFPSSFAAAKLLKLTLPESVIHNVANSTIERAIETLEARLTHCSKDIRKGVLEAYARPIVSQAKAKDILGAVN